MKTATYTVQVDWDRDGKWKDEDDFTHMDEAVKMCQEYDTQDRAPTPAFRVLKVESEVVWQGPAI